MWSEVRTRTDLHTTCRLDPAMRAWYGVCLFIKPVCSITRKKRPKFFNLFHNQELIKLLKLCRCYFNQLCIIIYPRSVLISARRYLPAYALTDKTSDQAYTKSLCCNRNVKTMISPLNKQYVFADWCTCTSTSSILIKLRDALQFDYYKGCFSKANYRPVYTGDFCCDFMCSFLLLED